jgi:hypothetical protein
MADTILTRGAANVTTLLTTTLENYRKEMQDNIFDEIPTIKWLKSKGKVSLSGGATIVEPLMYGQNTAATWFEGYDQVDITPQEGFTQAQYQWKELSVPVSVSDREENIQNAGPSAHFDIVQQKLKQSEMTMSDTINTQLFDTSIGAKEMDSLATVIDATGTIGEINSSTYSWWASDENTSGSFAAQGLSDLLTLYNALKVEGAKTDGLITRPTEEAYYEAAIRPHLRIASEKSGDLGFGRLTYKGIPIIADNDATSGVIYFVDSRHLAFYTRDNRNMYLTDFVRPANQNARTALLVTACQLGTNNRRRLGKLTGITA